MFLFKVLLFGEPVAALDFCAGSRQEPLWFVSKKNQDIFATERDTQETDTQTDYQYVKLEKGKKIVIGSQYASIFWDSLILITLEL